MKLIMKAIAVGFLLALVPAAASCGSRGSDLCKAKCDCERCSDNQLQACLVDYEEQSEQADDYNCGNAADDYAGCLLDKAICRGGDNWGDGNGSCSGQALVLDQCIKNNSSLRR